MKIVSNKYSESKKIGLETGGVVIGAAVSYKRYFELESSNISTTQSTSGVIESSRDNFSAAYALTKDKVQESDYTLGLTCGLDSCSAKVGILHNKVLEEIKYVELLANKQSLFDRFNPVERTLIDSKEFLSVYEDILNGTFDVTSHITLSDQIMSLFVEAVNKAEEDFDIVYRIISNYVSIVKKSKELSDNDKQSLYIGFAVMGYSYEYWSEIYSKTINNK